MKNFFASIVVFLVSIPLCLGIAVASGVPPGIGILSGIIGGLVVGSFSSSGLLISGPAGGLIAITLTIIDEYGLEKLGVFVLLAGLIQVTLGVFKLGTWFQAVSPSVVHGMLTGIGIIIFSRQAYVMFDLDHSSSTLENLISLPNVLLSLKELNPQHQLAAFISILTILMILLWEYLSVKLKNKFIKPTYSLLIAVSIAIIISNLFNLEINYLKVHDEMFRLIKFPDITDFSIFLKAEPFLLALTLTFIASIEAILSAIAIDKMSAGSSKNFNKEIIAQGLGNTVSGLLGLTPLTGVVLRGSANIQAGATNRSSAILQGVWLLLLVIFFSKYLAFIPNSCLAAILVYLSFRLINLQAIKELFKYGKNEYSVFFVTVFLIIVGDILLGVIVGILFSFFNFLYSFTKFEYKVTQDIEKNKTYVYLRGYASFFNLPQIAADLSKISKRMNLHIKFGKLSYIDYAFFDFLQTWEKQYIEAGGTVFVEWDQLRAEIFNPTKALSLFDKSKK